MSSISRRVAVITCRWPTGPRRVAGQRHVDPVLRQALLELGRPRAPGGGCRAASSSATRASLAALPTGPRSSGGSSRIQRRIVGELGLAAEVAHAQLLERARVGRLGDGGLGLGRGSSRRAVSAHRARHPIPLVQRDRGRHRDVERVRAVGAQRDCATVTSAASALGPAALRARPPRQSTTGGSTSSSASGPPAPRSSAIFVPGSSSNARASGRPREDRAHARAHRLRRVRVGAVRAEHHRAVGERVRGPDDRPDVAGVVDAVRGRPTARRRAPTSARGRRRRRACRTRARARQQLGLHVLARAQQQLRLPAARPRRRPGPRPRPRTARRGRFWRSLRMVLSWWLSFEVIIRVLEQKGRLAGRPGKFWCGLPIRQPPPPGRARQIGGRSRGRGRRCRPAPCGRARPRPGAGRA